MDFVAFFVLLLIMLFSIFVIYKKTQSVGVYSFKALITPTLLIMIGVLNTIALWNDAFGLISWMLTFVLLLFAAYFTKFLIN
ncbi:hypothetical protein [Alkalibacillus haloalkaliphilus]|uniref:Uncharacterized protein n=1 Tax=Alkalibacillus haloalkaliphilus TaxID=94136 RepID=A0A511W7L1_9BACI|nr:hypothetical protein [Alkalibacillus haloalkaliphilus]GEN47075.1 hypothetical protein AHA02nite_28510 [Alkalibacillus haloalkaliphilus]